MSEWENGLPGVGERCEVLDPKSGGWNGIEITGEGCDVLIAKRFERSEEEFMLNKTCEFRPIKKREPQPGEVWLLPAYGFEAIFCMDRAFRSFDDGVERANLSDMEFAAPSLEAYYEKKIARKLLKSLNSEGVAATVQIIRFTAEDPIN